MTPVSESSAASADADQAMPNDYDSFAEEYTAETEGNLVNGYYCRPAILDLAGGVAGRRILDAGCGSGPISAALRDRGAIVTGFDSSIKMLELARRRLGRGSQHAPQFGQRCRPVLQLFPAELETRPRFLCFLFFVLEAG